MVRKKRILFVTPEYILYVYYRVSNTTMHDF